MVVMQTDILDMMAVMAVAVEVDDIPESGEL
jgi:hypothetical protein